MPARAPPTLHTMKPTIAKFNKMIAIKPPKKNGKPKGVKKTAY